MKHRDRVIANRTHKACVKPKQIGLLDISTLLLPKKLQAFRCFLYDLRHVPIARGLLVIVTPSK